MKKIYTRMTIKGQEGEWNRHDIVNELVGGKITSGCDSNGKWEFTYLSGQTPPTEAEIDAEMVRLDKEWSDNEYARNRLAEYPSITDVTVALAEKMEGQPHFWNEITALRLEVKSKYPKG